MEYNLYFCCDRGTLEFWNKSFASVCVLVAHMSSLACSKVYEEAKLIPELLPVELLRRCEVWPKGFEKLAPTDQSIALYFFPEGERWWIYASTFISVSLSCLSLLLLFMKMYIYIYICCRSQKAFDLLVNAMMCKDLALKAVLKNAELLVFTSSMLPMRYWSKFHIWSFHNFQFVETWFSLGIVRTGNWGLWVFFSFDM